MVNNFKFDYVRFEIELKNQALQVFDLLRSQNESRLIFGYGLEAHVEFEPLYPFIITDENSNWQDCSPPKWDSCQRPDRDYSLDNMLWKLHRMVSKGMRSLDGMIISAREEGFTPEQIDNLVQAELEQYRQACLNALKGIEQKGFFGHGEEREKIAIILAFTGYADIEKSRILLSP